MTYTPSPPPGPAGEPPLQERASRRIASFIRSFTRVVWVSMGMALAGLAMKYLALTGGSFVFVFAMAVLTLLFLVQVGLSFFYVLSQARLALLGSVSSVALVLGLLALTFRYQQWPGWQVLFIIAAPLFILTAFFIGRYFFRRRQMARPHRTFLYRNLLAPYVFILALGIASLVLSPGAFNRQENERRHNPSVTPETEVEPDTAGLWRAY